MYNVYTIHGSWKKKSVYTEADLQNIDVLFYWNFSKYAISSTFDNDLAIII